MWQVGKSILLSKTVWTAAAGAVIAGANIAGYQITTAQSDQAIDLVLFVLTGIFRFTATQTLHLAAPSKSAPDA